MIVPSNLKLSFSFPVGTKYVMVNISFLKGDDSNVVLKRFMAKEDIPASMELALLSSINNMIKESTQDEWDAADERASMYKQHYHSLTTTVLLEDAAHQNIKDLHEKLFATNAKWHLKKLQLQESQEIKPFKVFLVQSPPLMRCIRLALLLRIKQLLHVELVSILYSNLRNHMQMLFQHWFRARL